MPNLPNQTYQTKLNVAYQAYELGLPNQNYWSKQSTPGSVVPLAMFITKSIIMNRHTNIIINVTAGIIVGIIMAIVISENSLLLP